MRASSPSSGFAARFASLTLGVASAALVAACAKEAPPPASSATPTAGTASSAQTAPQAGGSAAPAGSSAPSSAAPAGQAPEVVVGQPAPDFEAKDQYGKPIHLAELKGRPVVVYFYPKDETPGCTKEACAFRDGWNELKKRGVRIIGISTDSDESHLAFTEHHKLPFDLVSDPNGAIAAKYGVPNNNGYLARQSFVIAPDGTVKRIYRSVDVASHSADIAADLAR